MPESRIVPHGRTLRPVPLPEGTLDTIRACARRRRSARVAAVGSASATVLVLVAAAVLSGGLLGQRDDSLRIGPATPVVDSSPTIRPEPTLTTVPEDLALGHGAVEQVRTVGAAPRDTAQDPAVVAGDRPGHPASGESGPQAGHDPDAVRSNKENVLILPDCEQVGRGSAAGWCVSALADTGNERLALTVCRARGYDEARLEWASSQQVRFEVRDSAGALVWTHDPLARAEPDFLDLVANECVGWELRWGLRDEQGRPLPDGDYLLRAGSTGAPLDGYVVETPFHVGPFEPAEEPTPPRVPPVAQLTPPHIGEGGRDPLGG